jgi:hypothetical protein
MSTKKLTQSVRALIAAVEQAQIDCVHDFASEQVEAVEEALAAHEADKQAGRASAQAVPADQRTDVERAMDAYNGWCNRQGIHCNRLPAWSELDAKNKAEWMKKTAAAPKGD